MLKYLPLIVLFILTINITAQDLPKYLTEEEKIIWQTYSPIFNPENATPPPVPVRTMAEWEELQGLLITWTSQTTILREIVRAAQTECTVYIVCSDSNSVKSFLSSGGVPLVNLRFFIYPFNSIWIRDYGPWTVYSEVNDSLGIVDWVYNRPRPNDDNIPVLFANSVGFPLYQTTIEPNRLVHTGGNFMVDGLGTAFSSKLILNENSGKTEAQINAIMNAYMGINRYIKMDNLPYDGIHHIDMHMKLLDEETLLVGQYPPGVSDGPYIEANLQYVLSNFLTPYGKPYRVVRIPMPPDQFGRYPNNGGYYRTYTNSVIVNKTVIVPTYDPQYDTTALRIYREAMPGYKIVGIDCNSIIPSGGAIHCIVKEVGAINPLFISHSRVRDTLYTFSPIEIKTLIKTQGGVSQASVYWTTDTTLGYTSVPMSYLSGDTLVGYIPAQTNATDIYYYISATSNRGKTLTKPMTAPSGYYKLFVDDIIPVELVSFAAEQYNNNILLKWSTASEINNKGFEIERTSSSGFSIVNLTSLSQYWETIGFVEGSGSTTETRYYTFSDYNLPSGKYHYRLKQIDFDGSFSYSRVVESEIFPGDFEVQQNYPNPFNASTLIEFYVPEQSNVTVQVYNTLGEKIQETNYGLSNPGFNKLNLNFLSLPSGTYFYRLIAAGQNQNYSAIKKMVMTK